MFNNPIYESAFKQLDLLYEQDFNLNQDSVDEIKDFMDADEVNNEVDVIDLDATNEDELDDSNIGKIILQCPCCETIVCKNADEIELPDDCEGDEDCMVQVGEQCPVCFSEEGYKIIGKVAPYEEVEVEIEHKEEPVVKIDGDEVDFDKEGKAEIEVTPDEDGKVEVELVLDTEATEDEDSAEATDEDDADDEMETDFDDSEREVEAEDKKKNESLAEGILSAGAGLAGAGTGAAIGGAIGGVPGAIAGGAIGGGLGLAASAPMDTACNAVDNISKNSDIGDAAGAAALLADDASEKKSQECCNECDAQLTEGLNDINLETDTDRISIHAEQKAENGEEMIAPLDFQAANEIVDSQPEDEEANDYLDDIDTNNEESEDTIDNLNTDTLDAESTDADVNDFDENSFDNLGEAYFKSVYDNVNSYLTESVREKGDKLIVEGIITFTSGNKRKTSFMLEGHTLAPSGKCSMLVENMQITPGKKGYTLNGTLKNGKFISESLNYNYKQGTTKIKGTINF